MADTECFTGGSIAVAVIGTFAATLILGAFLLFLWIQYRKRRARSSPLHDLVMVEDGGARREDPKKNFGYDNPGFFDDSTDPKKQQPSQTSRHGIRQNGTGKQVANQDSSGKSKHTMPWGPLTFLFNRNAKHTLDDSALEEPQIYTASLKGHDFTGLGFNICGNMRDGIFIKDIMQRGPAAESKQILPGDRITSLTISFKHIVLDDALTLLSYASPYHVTLDMLRLPEKSLSHKGIHLLSGSSHLSGQGSSSPTTDMVCHPFFKSQSIDDLRKVGKQLIFKDEGPRKENGVKSHSPLPKEGRPAKSSPSKTKMESTQKTAGSSPKLRQETVVMIAPDEPDAGTSAVQQANVQPELIPRNKAKTITVKSEAVPPPGIIEAISPVVKMVYETERQQQTQTQPLSIVKPTRNSVKIACAEVPDPVLAHMANVSIKAESPTIAIEKEEIAPCPVQKPQRQKKSILSVLKEKTSQDKEKKQKAEGDEKPVEDDKQDKEHEKSKQGKFGIRVLPDISLNFGKKGPEKDENEKSPTSASPVKDKRKKEKTKQKPEEPQPMIAGKVGADDVELDLSLAVPKGTSGTASPTDTPSAEETVKALEERPPSTDSLDSAEKPASRKSSGFHLPNIGIKLPKFGHSKQYNLEAEEDHSHSEHNTSSSKVDNISSNVVVKKLDDSNEMNVTTMEGTSQLSFSNTDVPDRSAEGFKPIERSDTPKDEGKEKAGFMTKGLQSLRDLKDKVTHKLSSSHDTPSSSSSEDEGEKTGDVEDAVSKAKKEKREARAAAKLRDKQVKEEKAKEKAREKERLKAEKLAKKAELKRKSSKQASEDRSSESSSSDESDQDGVRQPRKKSKAKKPKGGSEDDKNGANMNVSKEEDVERIESAEILQEVGTSSSVLHKQSAKSKLVPAKPPVAPRKSKDTPKEGEEDKEDSEEKSKKKPKRERKDCASSSKSSCSSKSSSDSDSEGKVNKLAKRQAPTPPATAEAGTKGNLVVTKAEVEETPKNVHQHSTAPDAPEIVEATVKPKSKIPVKISIANTDSTSTRSRTPDKKSASFADLSSLQSTPKSNKSDSLERAVSMDMATEDDGPNARNSHIPHMVMSPVEDLSTATDSTMTSHASHYKHSQQSFSSSGSSSSETLKASPNSEVQLIQHQHIESVTNEQIRTSYDVHKMVHDTIEMINTGHHLKDGSQGRPFSETQKSSQNEVTISNTGSCTTDDSEISELRNIAQVAVDEILEQVNPHAEIDGNKVSMDVKNRSTNVTIMNIRNMSETPNEAPLDIQIEDSLTNTKAENSKPESKQLLRGDSKSRLMQLVADANDIKITQKSPQPKKDSLSPQISPEIRSDTNKPLFGEVNVKQPNGAKSSTTSQPLTGQTIQITATELDGIMMSHSEFLARQSVLHPVETLPKESSSFDSWVYVDQKHSLSTSPPDPPSAMTNNEEESSLSPRRNGALSPTSYRTATEFETSELRVTMSTPNSKPNKMYSTTMTLPQKTITQIILGPESGQNIEITSPLPTFK